MGGAFHPSTTLTQVFTPTVFSLPYSVGYERTKREKNTPKKQGVHLKVIGQFHLQDFFKKHITNKNITNNIIEKIHMCISGMKIKKKN